MACRPAFDPDVAWFLLLLSSGSSLYERSLGVVLVMKNDKIVAMSEHGVV